MFGATNATRSPGSTPAATSADASRLTRHSSSRYVICRSPWTTATLSGNTYALRRRKLSGDSSVRYGLAMVGAWSRLPRPSPRGTNRRVVRRFPAMATLGRMGNEDEERAVQAEERTLQAAQLG